MENSLTCISTLVPADEQTTSDVPTNEPASFPKPFLVGFGVDTLYLNVLYSNPDDSQKKTKRTLEADIMYELMDQQASAKEQECELRTEWSLDGVPLMMQEHGAGKGQWAWLLTSPLVDISISRGRLNGIIAQVRLSSRFLWHEECTGDALSKVRRLLVEIFGDEIYLQVSSVDLCADIVGWNPGILDWQERFLSRATGDNGYPSEGLIDGPDKAVRRWKQITGLIFGSYSGRLACKIYDKTLEIKQKSPEKQWFYPLWEKYGRRDDADVWRIEFHFTREFLRDLRIDSAYDLLDRFSEMWTYAVGRIGGSPDDGLPDGWLRLVVPNEHDYTRSRWPVDPAWEVIQSAFIENEELYRDLGDVVYHEEKEVNVRRMLAQVSGCLVSLAAHGADLYPELGMSLPDVMVWLCSAIEIRCHMKETSFPRLVDERRSKYPALKKGGDA
ncbi:MAG: hypothetical protein NVSMB54_15690 [Ktedonobacteraceae bacterium]